jgi:hypothetical protein
VARDLVGIEFVGPKGGLEEMGRLGCTKIDSLLCEPRSGLALLDRVGFRTPLLGFVAKKALLSLSLSSWSARGTGFCEEGE